MCCIKSPRPGKVKPQPLNLQMFIIKTAIAVNVTIDHASV